jgi:hypothetical protein
MEFKNTTTVCQRVLKLRYSCPHPAACTQYLPLAVLLGLRFDALTLTCYKPIKQQ